MKHFFQCVGLFVLIFSFPSFVVADNAFRVPEQCLYGLWKSDREKTVEYNLPTWKQKWDDTIPIERRLRAVNDIFGHMEWRFTPDGIYASDMPIYKDEKAKGRYSIVKIEKNFFRIHIIDNLNKEEFDTNVFFETPNSIWTPINSAGALSNSREYFRRITPTPEQCVMPKK